MSVALICGANLKTGASEPLNIQGMNIEDSYLTDAPSITAAVGFAYHLATIDGMKFEAKGLQTVGVRINSVALIIHDLTRDIGLTGYSNAGYKPPAKELFNPTRPIEIKKAAAKISILIDYDGRLPPDVGVGVGRDLALNRTTARYGGGVVLNDLRISEVSDTTLVDYLGRYMGRMVCDRSDLNITSLNEMLTYVARYGSDRSKKYDGVFYIHQSGYQMLENPQVRSGSLEFDGKVCKHAFCNPILNLVELVNSSNIKTIGDVCFWERVSNTHQKTSILKSVKYC